MKIPKQINVKTALIFVAISILITSGLFYVFAATPSSTFYISSGVYPGAPSYTVWKEGSYYFAKNAYGQIPSGFSGTNASDILQNCFDALTDGGTVLLQNDITLTTRIEFSNNGIELIGDGIKTVTINFDYAGECIRIGDGITKVSYGGIKNIEFEGAASFSVDQYAIHGFYSTGLTIQDCDFNSMWGNNSWAIVLQNSSAYHIEHCRFWNNYNGIIINGSSYNTINEIFNNYITRATAWDDNSYGTGIWVGSQAAGTTITDNCLENHNVRIHTDANGVTIKGNYFEWDESKYLTDIKLDGSYCEVLGNQFSENLTVTGYYNKIICNRLSDYDIDDAKDNIVEGTLGASFPTNAIIGQQFYRTDLYALYVWNSTHWVAMGEGEAGPAGPPGATTQFGAYTFIIYKNATAVATQARDWRGALHYSDADADSVFQDCIDEMDFYNEGGIIFVKNGTYTFDTRVQVDQSGITIKGESQQSVTFSWNGGTNNFMWQIENGYTELRDFSIDMNDVSGCTAIWIDNSPRNIIYNIEITEVAVDGIYLNSTGETNSNRIEKCTIRQPGRSGVYIDDDIGHTLVNDCVISDRTSGTKVTDYAIYSTSDEKENKFTNNRIWGVINGICLDDVTAVVIQDNIMTDNDRCILLLQSNNDVLISGNRFWYTNRVNPTTDDNRSDIVFESSSDQWCGVITDNQGHGQSVARHFIWCSNIDIMEQWVIDGNACLEYVDTEYDQGAQSGLTVGDNT